MTYCVTKAASNHFINGNCHIKQLKSRKSRKTCLTNHTQSTLHNITPLVINALMGRHTQIDTHTDVQSKAISSMPGLKMLVFEAL